MHGARCRWRWIEQAFLGLCDLINSIPLLIVLCTGVRTRQLLRLLRSEAVRKEYDKEKEYNPKAAEVVWAQFGYLLCDIVNSLPLLLVLCTGVRTRKLLRLLRSEAVRKEYNRETEFNPKAAEMAWEQFGSLLADLIFVPIALLLLLSGRWLRAHTCVTLTRPGGSQSQHTLLTAREHSLRLIATVLRIV